MAKPERRRQPRVQRGRWRLPGLRGRKISDRGTNPVEFAIIAFPMIVVTLIVVQAGFVFLARSTALAAATQGANAGRVYNVADPNRTARDHATTFLDLAGGQLSNPNVTTRLTATELTVTVTGEAFSVIPIPGMTFPVTQSAHGPIERWVP